MVSVELLLALFRHYAATGAIASAKILRERPAIYRITCGAADGGCGPLRCRCARYRVYGVGGCNGQKARNAAIDSLLDAQDCTRSAIPHASRRRPVVWRCRGCNSNARALASTIGKEGSSAAPYSMLSCGLRDVYTPKCSCYINLGEEYAVGTLGRQRQRRNRCCQTPHGDISAPLL